MRSNRSKVLPGVTFLTFDADSHRSICMLRCIFHKVVEIVHCCNLRSTRSPSVSEGNGGNENNGRRITNPFSNCPNTRGTKQTRLSSAQCTVHSDRWEVRGLHFFTWLPMPDPLHISHGTLRYSRTVFGSRVRASIWSIDRSSILALNWESK